MTVVPEVSGVATTTAGQVGTTADRAGSAAAMTISDQVGMTAVPAGSAEVTTISDRVVTTAVPADSGRTTKLVADRADSGDATTIDGRVHPVVATTVGAAATIADPVGMDAVRENAGPGASAAIVTIAAAAAGTVMTTGDPVASVADRGAGSAGKAVRARTIRPARVPASSATANIGDGAAKVVE